VDFIRGELAGWRPWELALFAGSIIAIAAISISFGDNAMNFTAAVTGVTYTLLAGKGKISCYLFGIVNTVLYGLASARAELYGETILNWGYYLPMMFVGLAMWARNRDDQANVRKTRLSARGRIITAAAAVAGIAAFAVLLAIMNDAQPIVDSTTTVLSVVATILTVRRCAEQWLLWMIVNSVSIIMWLRVYLAQGNSLALLAMWCIFLFIGIIFYIQWTLEVSRRKR
ncbi:MAG: nicotinamide mononucleotide transporter, partial [Victivallales bacterium]|nr:nicotinamide mononucleotide transporter [Victivallales bacterium]